MVNTWKEKENEVKSTTHIWGTAEAAFLGEFKDAFSNTAALLLWTQTQNGIHDTVSRRLHEMVGGPTQTIQTENDSDLKVLGSCLTVTA